MKKIVIIWSLVVILSLILGTTAVEATASYDSMMSAIQNWYQSNPKIEFHSAEAQKVFEWRVALAKFDYVQKVERFGVHETLLNEIGDYEFSYDNYQYNSKSTRAKMLADYPFTTYDQTIVDPIVLFDKTYHWYTEAITDTREHIYWLRELLWFVHWLSDAGDNTTFCREYATELNEMCQQWIALIKTNEGMSTRFWRDTYDIYFDSEFSAKSYLEKNDLTLRPLYFFVRDVAAALTDRTKDAIVKLIVPDYIDDDWAVRIYSVIVD